MAARSLLRILILIGTIYSSFGAIPVSAENKTAAGTLARGRYLTIIAGCNDCHTAGFAPSGGKVPEKDWLTGDALGWYGPWGTTYAANLRLYFNRITETQWLAIARVMQTRPPMPAYILHTLSDEDLRSLYRFIRSLGPAGKEAPAYLPPGKVPPMPYAQFPLS